MAICHKWQLVFVFASNCNSNGCNYYQKYWAISKFTNDIVMDKRKTSGIVTRFVITPFINMDEGFCRPVSIPLLNATR